MSTPDEPAATPPRRRISAFVVVGVLGVAGILVLVGREVALIREGERDIDRRLAELEARDAADAADARTGDGVAERAEETEVVVRLAEVQRQGPGVGGRYHLDVGPTRWALDVPPSDAEEAVWSDWEVASRPRWAALAEALHDLAGSGVHVRAEIFEPWQAARDGAPERLLLRLFPILAAAGILEVDVEHAPPTLLEGD